MGRAEAAWRGLRRAHGGGIRLLLLLLQVLQPLLLALTRWCCWCGRDASRRSVIMVCCVSVLVQGEEGG